MKKENTLFAIIFFCDLKRGVSARVRFVEQKRVFRKNLQDFDLP